MAYSDFTTIKSTREQLGVEVIEQSFLPPITSVAPTELLAQSLSRYRPRALTINTEKARSELLIAPILFEMETLIGVVSVFSGKQFNVNPELGLVGYLDFIVTQSPEKIEITAPAIIVVEAKSENIIGGLGQCIAAMVAAYQFNQQQDICHSRPVYGSVTTGDRWRFLKLAEMQVTIDLDEYVLPPIEPILGILTWMATQKS